MQMMTSVQKAASEWVDEAQMLLGACARLVEYFGTDLEEQRFRAAMETPLALLATVRQRADVDELMKTAPAEFVASEEVVRIVSPLLQIICEPMPEFVHLAKASEDVECKWLLHRFATFAGTFSRYVCKPIWQMHPHLAPENWPL